MKHWTRWLAATLLGWYVVTYSGQPVAGPFTLLNDCQDMARYMSQRYYNVSQVCQWFND